MNPLIDAEHGIVRSLESRGIAVVLAANEKDAWQLLQLHGTSVDLAVIHRESFNGTGDPGLTLLKQIKADTSQADLPIIITSVGWTAPEFADHQASPEGANAYLKAPIQEDELLELISAVTGESFGQAPPVQERGSVRLEESSAIFQKASSDSSFSLEPSLPTAAIEMKPGLDAHSLSVGDLPSAELSSPELSQFGKVEPSESESSIAVPGEPSVSGGASLSIDMAAAHEMPYLFNAQSPQAHGHDSPQVGMLRPIGDAVVPGGAAHSPDIETLKKYLLLREQDVAALSAQMRNSREQISALEAALHQEKSANVELRHGVDERQRRIDQFEREKEAELESVQRDLNETRFQLKTKNDKIRLLESQMKEASSEIEKIRERVRGDIRKIRVREKELENRLEIMKKDSEALLGARENKIIELKRKLDLVEFNMDLLQSQYSREKETSAKLRERLVKAAQVVKVAGGLLGSELAGVEGLDDPEPKDQAAS